MKTRCKINIYKQTKKNTPIQAINEILELICLNQKDNKEEINIIK